MNSLQKSNKQKFLVQRLNSVHAPLIHLPYIPVFSSHPWHEEFESSCGHPGTYAYGCSVNGRGVCDQFDGSKLIQLTKHVLDSKCPNPACNKSVGDCITPVFTPESVANNYSMDLQKPGFNGFGSLFSGELIGFAWGYNFPTNFESNGGSVSFERAADNLMGRGISPEFCFYHNESGTIPRYQGNGVGTSLLRNMLADTPKDRRFVVFRTINPGMIRCYEKVFELPNGGLKPVFKDPNPLKRQHWYALDLKILK